MNIVAFFTQSKLWEFWGARDARERVMLTVAAVTVAAALYYVLLIAPAMTGRDRLAKSLPNLRQQTVQLQAMAKDAGEFSAKGAVAAMSEESIKAALARKGLIPQGVVLTGDNVKVQLATVSFAAMLDWLDDIQKNDGVSLLDATVAAQAQPDMVNATLILRQ